MRYKISVVHEPVDSIDFSLDKLGETGISDSWAPNILYLDNESTMP